MSQTILTITQKVPTILTNYFEVITGENIAISGELFKQDIIQISGENIYDSNLFFNVYGQSNDNVSGINNTIDENIVIFSVPTGILASDYDLYLYNSAGKSTNSLRLKIIDRPKISGIDLFSGLPGDFVRISGSNFYFPTLKLIDQNNGETDCTVLSGLNSISDVNISNPGTGYNIGDKIFITGTKLYSTNSSGILEISTTGINGSVGSFNIIDSGIFTVTEIDQTNALISTLNGSGLEFSLTYNNYKSGLLDIIEFVVPYGKKLQSGLLENFRYKGADGAVFTGFNILGIPEIYSLSSLTGTVDQDVINISGANLDYVQNIYVGNFAISNFNNINTDNISFLIPNFAESNFITVSGLYGADISRDRLNITYPRPIISGFSPNKDILIGTGTIINISGKYLQRLSYLNLGQRNILKKSINITESGTKASFLLPDDFITNNVYLYSDDFIGSGLMISSPETNDRIIVDQKLNSNLLNLRYLSGINAAKYLDQIEFFTSDQFSGSGDYGNIDNSEIFFLAPTGKSYITGSFNVSGIKVSNTPNLIRVQIPREVDNPVCRIKINRKKYNDEYILATNQAVNILPTIESITSSNTLNSPVGEIKISGINATNATKIIFSGFSGNKNIFGFKDAPNLIVLDTISKDKSQIDGGNNTGYTVFTSKLGGDYTGSGQAFLIHPYYETGLGYENSILFNKVIDINPISGFRPQNSEIFTSPAILTSPLDEPFVYDVQTNSKASKFEIYPTTISGFGEASFPSGYNDFIFTGLNDKNQIVGIPYYGGKYYVKIKAVDGDKPNEGMILQLAFGVSGRSLSGPGIVYRGEWNSGTIYVGNSLRRDVIKYSNNGVNYWYATQINSGEIPSSTNINWLAFSNEFGATATQILLAEQSNITTSLNIGTLGITSGFIKSVNDVNNELGSGFFLGYDNSVGAINPALPKFRVGNSETFIKWDGSGLNIVGPLSGVVTTSRNVINSNNSVDSNFSVAIGLNNQIYSDSDNSFIFGDTNIIGKSRKSAIVGGQSNTVTGTEAFITLNSNILGGENNYVIGSYSNIGGGKANFISTVSTGLSQVSNQNFQTDFSGSNSRTVKYPIGVFTDDLCLLNSYQKRNNTKYFEIDSSEITNYEYRITLPSILTNEENNIIVNTFLATQSDNLYSGSFFERNNSTEFKTFKTAIISGQSSYEINFPTPFTGTTNNIVIIPNLKSQNFYQTIITGITSGKFFIDFGTVLTESFTGTFFAAKAGYYTGFLYNTGYILEINSFYPFQNIVSSTGNVFTTPRQISSQSTGISFNSIYKYDSRDIYGSQLNTTGTSSNLSFIINKNINSLDEYLNAKTLTFPSGNINSGNFKIGTNTFASASINTITLTDAMPSANYATILNIGSPTYYPYLIRNKTANNFVVVTSGALSSLTEFSYGAFNTGQYKLYNVNNCSGASGTLTGPGNNFDILFGQYNFDNKPSIFSSLISGNTTNKFYIHNINNISKSGFTVRIDPPLLSGERLGIDYVAIDGTGDDNAYVIRDRQLIYTGTFISGDIEIDIENLSTRAPVKIYPKVTSNISGAYLTCIDRVTPSYFSFTISDLISGIDIATLKCDYILTDLFIDENSAFLTLGAEGLGRLAGFGFDDVGSSSIAGGTGNYIRGVVSTIGAGIKNTIIGDYNIIPGGRSNSITDAFSENVSLASFSAILGGLSNTITGNVTQSIILGGRENTLFNLDRRDGFKEEGAFIIGGRNNIYSGSYGGIIGGHNNYVTGDHSYSMGNSIVIRHSGVVFLGDGKDDDKQSVDNNSLHMSFDKIIIDINKLPTGSGSVPVGGLYRNGSFIQIRAS